MIHAAISSLATTPNILQSMIACVEEEHLIWKPSPTRWSIAENITHIVDVELRNTGLRVRSIAEQDRPAFIDYDQNVEYEKGTYSAHGGREALARFEEVRAESIGYLEGLPQSALEREGIHPTVGPVRIGQILSLWAFHDLSHIRQIAEIIKATTFWDGIGSLQHYYAVSP